jgi:hypothetical protein
LVWFLPVNAALVKQCRVFFAAAIMFWRIFPMLPQKHHAFDAVASSRAAITPRII